MVDISSTQQSLLDSGKKLFLEKGFKSAPLRKIVADAGFTLGAFYGYYKTKEDLFYALTDEVAETFTDMMQEIAKEMDEIPAERRLYTMIDCYNEKLPEVVGYVCVHRDEMTLLIKCSEGTKYENFLGGFSGKGQAKIAGAVELARESGKSIGTLDPVTFDLLMDGYYSMLGNILLTESEPDKILAMMSDIAIVYKEGIIGLLEQKKRKSEVEK